MKKFVIFCIISFFTVPSVFAQKGKNQISLGPEADLPVGTFGNAYKLGFGGSVKGLLGVGQSGQVTLTVGYSTFKGKSGTSYGYSYAGQTYNIIPYLVGYRQNFKTLYVEPQLGFASYTTKAAGFKGTETRLTYGVGVGISVNSLDLGLRYQSHEGSSLIGLRVAYVINFKTHS
jgi:hypothetical protein